MRRHQNPFNTTTKKQETIMQQIERSNPLFCEVYNEGSIINRSPLLQCSGKYNNCIQHDNKVYEGWINWGYDELFLLDANDLNNTVQDPEGRVNERLAVDTCQCGTEIIRSTPPPPMPDKVRKHSDGWGCCSNTL